MDYCSLVSAFTKLKLIEGEIHNITLGPKSILNQSNNDKNNNEKLSINNNEKKTIKKSLKNKNLLDNSENNCLSLTPLKFAIKQYEEIQKEKVQEKIKKRLELFENSTIKNNVIRSQWISQQQAFIESTHEKQQNIVNEIQQPNKDSQQLNNELVQHYQRKIEMEQQIKKNNAQRLLKENLDIITKCQIEFNSCFRQIYELFQNPTYSEELKNFLGQDINQLKILTEKIEKVVNDTKQLQINSDNVNEAINATTNIRKFKNKIEEFIDIINTKKNECPIQQIEQPAEIPVTSLAETPSQNINDLDNFISSTNYIFYNEIMEFFTRYRYCFKELFDDDRLKQFTFDCKKAVNIPVNALSAASYNHLLDKYNKLYNLLSGKPVLIGNSVINAAKHPQGITFCTDLLAKKFILQGDLMISSNPEASYCYATIIVTLWNDFPDFGKLLIGYFFKQCPYLVPFYIPKMKNQSDEDHYISLGYQYKDGQIEKQDKFLKRMTGIMRLYFAILVTKPKTGCMECPYNIKIAWKWIASILKLQPQLDITATALHTFLDTIGYQMQETYGIIFKRIIKIIKTTFIQNIKKIDTGGPVTRLEVLLQEYHDNGDKFNSPNGLLPVNFW